MKKPGTLENQAKYAYLSLGSNLGTRYKNLQKAKYWLNYLGFEPVFFESEEEARNKTEKLINEKKWPCYFFKSDTTGEKELEEFFTEADKIDLDRFLNIGVVINNLKCEKEMLDGFSEKIELLKKKKYWTKKNLVDIFMNLLPNFTHLELGKSLDDKL